MAAVLTYSIDIGPGPVILAALLALIIAWVTVGGHALKAAHTNSAENLHYK